MLDYFRRQSREAAPFGENGLVAHSVNSVWCSFCSAVRVIFFGSTTIRVQILNETITLTLSAETPSCRRYSLERETVIRLSQRDAQKVFSLLDHSPKANKRLNEAVKAYRATVRA